MRCPLGAILGGMMCTDMGGPVNKAAYAFGVGLLSTGNDGPMAAIMAARYGVIRWQWAWQQWWRVANSTKRSRKVAKPLWYWDCALFRKVHSVCCS